MKKVAIVSAVRTAVGNFLGSLSTFSAPKLGSIVIKEVLRKINLKEELVDEVIMGNILQAGLGQNPARQSAILAGIPHTVPSHTVNKVCGSGLKAVILAAQSIMLGDADIIVAGGTENMSAAPYLLDKARTGYRLGHAKIIDSMIQDGLWCSLTNIHMGLTAENLAQKYALSREAQDQFALESQKKAAQAQKNGKFKEEIVEIKIPQKKGDPILFSADEFIKLDTSLEKLAKLKPAFKDNGTVTAGNASGINDGAAAVILMSEEKANEFNLIPLAYIKGYAYSGVAPDIMGIGPVEAVKKVLNKTNLKIEDLELIEANEAFASQSLAVIKELNFNPEKVNVNGGAIALGHPIGASGTRILVTLLYEMKRRNLRLGLSALCIGGGQGISLIVERM